MIDKKNRIVFVLLMLAAGLWTAGCAPTFPREVTDRIDRRVTFKELQGDPEKFKGSWVMLAGVIVSSRNTKEGTSIEVLQKPMDSDGRPHDTDETEGRFLIQTEEFLDSAVYHRGRVITVVGEVAGRRTMPVDETTYQYPLLVAKALHLWRPSTGPQFFFGIGVSHRL
jgi:outer membrane lipoprotein